jgi:hypothetical protein
MRTILVVALAANLFLSAWASNLQATISGKIDAVSIDPIGMPESAANLPIH